jgi:sarcosine oxidase subunit gamma
MVAARNGRLPALTAVVREELDLDLPLGPTRVVSGKFAFSGIGPGIWLADLEDGGNGFADMLQKKLDGLASVSDWSDGYGVLRLTGRNLRETLAKIVAIDLHPRVFKLGTVACTQPYGAILWHLGDAGDGLPAIEVAVSRSYAEEFWHELIAGAAGCG